MICGGGIIMYRKVEDFLGDWKQSSDGTLRVIQEIADDKLDFAIVEGHNSLGWLAWHLVGAAGAFAQFGGLQVKGIERTDPQPASVDEIVTTYENIANAISEEAKKLTDDSLTEEVSSFVGPTERGRLLRMLIDHQNHHRSQMTVLLRQAGLKVPPVMGPTKEMQ